MRKNFIASRKITKFARLYVLFLNNCISWSRNRIWLIFMFFFLFLMLIKIENLIFWSKISFWIRKKHENVYRKIFRVLYLVDYGLAKIYQNEREGHLKDERKNMTLGTNKYMSINVSKCRTPCRRDDLISICYILFELLLGFLPWGTREIMMNKKCRKKISRLKYWNQKKIIKKV